MENDHVWQLLNELSGGRGWMGYSDSANPDHWQWEDGQNQYTYTRWLFTFPLISFSKLLTRWADNEPNGGVSENCGELMANGFWNDLPCDNLAPFACKMEATTEGSDPSLPETTTQAGS